MNENKIYGHRKHDFFGIVKTNESGLKRFQGVFDDFVVIPKYSYIFRKLIAYICSIPIFILSIPLGIMYRVGNFGIEILYKIAKKLNI